MKWCLMSAHWFSCLRNPISQTQEYPPILLWQIKLSPHEVKPFEHSSKSVQLLLATWNPSPQPCKDSNRTLEIHELLLFHLVPFSAENYRMEIAGVWLSNILPSPVEKNDRIPHTNNRHEHSFVKKSFTYLVCFELTKSSSKLWQKRHN